MTAMLARKRSCAARAGVCGPRADWFAESPEAEGGCGVTGFACTIPVGGKHIYEPSIQMHNRGNGKGGGIAACGLVPEELGVSRKVLDEDYILQVALLDPTARGEVEKAFIEPYFDVDQGGMMPTVDDYRDVPLLGGPPAGRGPLLRPRQAGRAARRSPRRRACRRCPPRELEDEFVYQNSHPAERRSSTPRWATSGPSCSRTPGT